jgi:hypothetical protein
VPGVLCAPAEDAPRDGEAVIESLWLQFTSERQRFWHPPRLNVPLNTSRQVRRLKRGSFRYCGTSAVPHVFVSQCSTAVDKYAGITAIGQWWQVVSKCAVRKDASMTSVRVGHLSVGRPSRGPPIESFPRVDWVAVPKALRARASIGVVLETVEVRDEDGLFRVRFNKSSARVGLTGWVSVQSVDGQPLLKQVTKEEADTVLAATAAMRGQDAVDGEDGGGAEDVEEEEEEEDGDHACLRSMLTEILPRSRLFLSRYIEGGHAAGAGTDGTPDPHAGRYVVMKRCAVRSRFSVESKKVGSLEVEEEVDCVRSRVNPETGQVRLRVEGRLHGWVSWAFRSCMRSIPAEIYLCHACSCHEILRAETPPGRCRSSRPPETSCSRSRRRRRRRRRRRASPRWRRRRRTRWSSTISGPSICGSKLWAG